MTVPQAKADEPSAGIALSVYSRHESDRVADKRYRRQTSTKSQSARYCFVLSYVPRIVKQSLSNEYRVTVGFADRVIVGFADRVGAGSACYAL